MPIINVINENGKVDTYKTDQFVIIHDKEDAISVVCQCSLSFIMDVHENDLIGETVQKMTEAGIAKYFGAEAASSLNKIFGKEAEASEADRECNCRACHAARRSPIH